MNCLYAKLESNDHNNAGASVTLYFEGTPTAEDVQAALDQNTRLCLADEQYGFVYEVSTKPEKHLKPGVVRVQVYPS